jgi:hypothetical protein
MCSIFKILSFAQEKLLILIKGNKTKPIHIKEEELTTNETIQLCDELETNQEQKEKERIEIKLIVDKFMKHINKFIYNWYKNYYFKEDYLDFNKCTVQEKEYIVNIIQSIINDTYLTTKYNNKLTIICAIIWYYYYINILEYYIIDDSNFTIEAVKDMISVKILIADLATSDEPIISIIRRKILFPSL